ncbi:MAG TPA: methyl-accepting chemotaxis protein, partial [Clostridia bacterium]|nr:methyl-accepting chemotaxis protein [Clostridia bacterium]
AATAEENSATSEEMAAQAVTLREEVGKFKLSARESSSKHAALEPERAKLNNSAELGAFNGFGKY